MGSETRYSIIIIDDNPDSIRVLGHSLRDEYDVTIATSGETGLKRIEENNPDVILLDVTMPGMDGYETCSRLKQNVQTKNIPVIFVTANDESHEEEKGLDLGAVDYITKPFNIAIVKKRIKTQLALYNQNRILEEKVRERTEEVRRTRIEIIRRLSRAADYKDDTTGTHILRMSKYAQVIALQYGLSESEAELILTAAPMHDIGKIGISDDILLKPDKLTPEELEIMQQHPVIGAQIIGDHDSALLKLAKECALTHHEWWDGTGYPNGLKGEEIPLIGRITALADVFDALTSVRPYKKAFTVEEAVNEIKACKGTQFDPGLVDIFIRALPGIIAVREQYS